MTYPARLVPHFSGTVPPSVVTDNAIDHSGEVSGQYLLVLDAVLQRYDYGFMISQMCPQVVGGGVKVVVLHSDNDDIGQCDLGQRPYSMHRKRRRGGPPSFQVRLQSTVLNDLQSLAACEQRQVPVLGRNPARD